MKPLARFFGAALVGAFALLATPAAQAQVGVNINIGAPAWGPQVPYGTQYYYIPEIDGYYDLYNQQYIVYQDGYWVPLPELYGYDPYQFHPVIVDYRGPQPWLRVDYYRQHYAYQPYRNYGPSRAGYYNGGYGYGPSYGRSRTVYSNGRNYNEHDDRGGYRGNDDRGGYRGNDNRGGAQYPSGGYSTPRGNQQPQQPQGGGYNPGQGGNGGNGGGFGGNRGGNQGQQGGGNYGGGGRSGGHGRG
ncbi:hypothetical protein [Hymenobacter rubidus]|uniref:hypothetical protein n=1 Tax=Hymenobacter rubidus TaxID=1441626 RepID=UPI00191F0FAD|nr:hypothetical protein [Hymenobacter rubidus]